MKIPTDKLPPSWEVFKTPEELDISTLMKAIKLVPKRQWDLFFERIQAQVLQGALSSDKDASERAIASAKATIHVQNFFTAVLD